MALPDAAGAATAASRDAGALQRAIEAWHEGLTPELAGESWQWLTDQLSRRRLFFGDRPLCTVLRPRFLTPARYDLLRARIAVLLGAFDTVLRAALAHPALLDQFHLDPVEHVLALEEPRIPASPVSRLDAFFDPALGLLRFTEYNAEPPPGSAYGDALAELFLAIPAARPFLKTHALRPLPARPHVLHALLGAWHQWSGRRDLPVVGILDWQDVPTVSEFVLYQEYFASMGIRCGLGHPIVRAVRSGAVCMVNPFRCKILHQKASLAVLGDERNTGLFTPAERLVIAEQIPWTRVVEERKTVFQGATIDLVPWIARNRERLVLKPNDAYGGAGIVLGWEVDAAAWNAALAAALEAPYIVQERIALPSESFPPVADGALVFADRIVDTAPFVFGGAYADGCLTRVSTATLVNVTAGGGSTVPTFVVEQR